MESVWLILFFVTCALHSCTAKKEVTLMELTYGTNTSAAFNETSAIFDQAVVDLREKYSSEMSITRVRVHGQDVCYSAGERFAFLASRSYYREVSPNASTGIFYPACSLWDGALADLTREWNMPLFVPAGADLNGFIKIKRFPNQIRLASLNWVDFLNNVLKEFRFTTVGIVCADDGDRWECDRLTSWMFASRYNFTAKRFDVYSRDSKSIGRSLEDIRAVTRAVVLIASNISIRQIMLAAFDKGMADGNYVYLTFDNFNRNVPTFLSGNNSGEHSEDIRTAFRSLFTISFNIQNTSEYHKFTKEVKRLSAEKYAKTYNAAEEISLRSVLTYFAVALYGQVLNESIANNRETKDGAALARLMQNRTFTILGNEIIINSNGDRESNWVLNQMDQLTNTYRPVLTDYDGGKSIRPFRDPSDKSIHPIVWFNRTGPPTE